jgi:transcriptional regulator GlxA family with amidase domain
MKRRIGFFLYQGMAGLDVTGPVEVFHAADLLLANDGKKDAGYDLRFSAISPGLVTSSSGLVFSADEALDALDIDTFILPGGLAAESLSNDPEITAAIRKAGQKAAYLVSVCSGAFFLAAAGFLAGRRVTTHWLVAERLAAQYPEVSMVSDAIYIEDGHVATSGGVTAGIDLALALVEKDYGPELAIEVARVLLLYRRRPGKQSQFSNTLALQAKVSKRFKPLTDWLDLHLTEKLTVEQLAERVHMSPRTFARVFPSEIGISPARFIELLRLDRARELLESGAQGLERVTRESGFGREERLRRAFLRRLGISPAQYQAHFTKGDQHEQTNNLRDISF